MPRADFIRWRNLRPCGQQPRWRCFELIDPDGLPRFVGCGPVGWRPLWTARHVLDNRLGEWLRGLNREPVECTRWVPSSPIKWDSAIRLRDARLAQIVDWSGGQWPEWLANEPPRPDAENGRWARRIIAIGPGGSVRTYKSLNEASRDLGVSRFMVWKRLADGLGIDGWTYHDGGTSLRPENAAQSE